MNRFLGVHIGKHIKGFFGLLIHFIAIAFYLIFLGLLGFIVSYLIFNFLNKNHVNMVYLRPFFTLIPGIYLFILCPIFILILTMKARPYYCDPLKQQAPRKNLGDILGDARFSTLSEAYATGLRGNGIVFGRQYNYLVTKPANVEGHALIIGGTGTGKSRGVAIPTLFQWEGAVLAIDIKGELSRITANYRQKYGRVFVFDPEHGGAGYDPIAQCGTLAEAQDLARTLIPKPKNVSEPFWIDAAQGVFSAVAFEGSLTGQKLCDIAEYLCTEPISSVIEHCRNSQIREVRTLASVAYDIPEKTQASVIAELRSHLITLATDTSIRNATSSSEWSPQTLETGATVYLRVSESMLDQYKDLWTIIISQVLRYLSNRPEKKNPPILIELDEMARLSEINGLSAAMATLRSRNVHIMGIIQSMAQLDTIYSPEQRKVIADNCRFKFILSATDPDTQKYFSDLAGQRTVYLRSTSKRDGLFQRTSHGISQSKTELLRPEQFARLDYPILFAPNLHPLPLDLAFWDIMYKSEKV